MTAVYDDRLKQEFWLQSCVFFPSSLHHFHNLLLERDRSNSQQQFDFVYPSVLARFNSRSPATSPSKNTIHQFEFLIKQHALLSNPTVLLPCLPTSSCTPVRFNFFLPCHHLVNDSQAPSDEMRQCPPSELKIDMNAYLKLEPDKLARVEINLAQKTAETRYLQHVIDEKEQQLHQFEQKAEWAQYTHALFLKLSQYLRQADIPTQIFSLVVTEIQTLFQSDRVCIYQYHPSDGGGLVIAEAVQPPFANTLGYIIRDEIIAGSDWLKRYQQGEVCILENLDQCQAQADQKQPLLAPSQESSQPDCDRSFHLWQFFEVKAKLAVPIFYQQNLWGLLVIHQCAQNRVWQDFEIQTLQLIAIQISSLVAQIELQEIVHHLKTDIQEQRQEHRTHLADTIDFEAMLKRITARVRDSLDETQILQTAIQELAAVLNVEQIQSVACVALGAGECGIAQEHELKKFVKPKIPLHQYDLTDLCPQLQRGEMIQFCPMLPWLNRSEQSILVCPVIDSQGCLGSLRFYRGRHQIFTEQELQLIQQVASHCAIAIRQARLYQASCIHVQELEQLSRLKDDFLSTVSHELRTPLSSIKMVTSLLKLAMQQAISQAEAQPLNAAQKQKIGQYLKVLEDECEREISLINDLLASQHLDTGQHPLAPAKIDLQEWLPQTLQIFQHRTQMNQQNLVIQLPMDLPPIVSDTFMLSRVIVELLNNACKYTPPNGQIFLRAIANSNTIEFIVENTGTQIPSDQLQRIFDPFYRIPADDRWKRSGTGLGLFLIKRFVEYLGGTIQAKNLLDSVQFIVTLPQAVATV